MQPVYGKWETSDVERALTSIKNGDMGFKSAVRWYGVFLHNYKCSNKIANQETVHFGTHCALTAEMEDEIVKHVLFLQQLMFPITKVDLQRLAFQFAKGNRQSKRFSKNKGIARQKRFAGFLVRYSELPLRRARGRWLIFFLKNVDRFGGLGCILTMFKAMRGIFGTETLILRTATRRKHATK